MIHRTTNTPISVIENRQEQDGYRSIVFRRPAGFTYESGDWIDIDFFDKNLKGGRTYTLSSSPTEPELMITFKDGISEIKNSLAALQEGDRLVIAQYGNDYNFTLNTFKSSMLMAGGVGIAPFRSMIKEAFDEKSSRLMTLLYLNKTENFLFRQELDHWCSSLAGLSITYVITDGLQKKQRQKVILDNVKSIDQLFYIAGPEGMVESTEHLLLDAGVKVGNIRIDSFGGY